MTFNPVVNVNLVQKLEEDNDIAGAAAVKPTYLLSEVWTAAPYLIDGATISTIASSPRSPNETLGSPSAIEMMNLAEISPNYITTLRGTTNRILMLQDSVVTNIDSNCDFSITITTLNEESITFTSLSEAMNYFASNPDLSPYDIRITVTIDGNAREAEELLEDILSYLKQLSAATGAPILLEAEGEGLGIGWFGDTTCYLITPDGKASKCWNSVLAERVLHNWHYNNNDHSYIYEFSFEGIGPDSNVFDVATSISDELDETIDSCNPDDFWYYDGNGFKIYDAERLEAYYKKIKILCNLLIMIEMLLRAQHEARNLVQQEMVGIQGYQGMDTQGIIFKLTQNRLMRIYVTMNDLLTNIQEYNAAHYEKLVEEIEDDHDGFLSKAKDFVTGGGDTREMLREIREVTQHYEAAVSAMLEGMMTVMNAMANLHFDDEDGTLETIEMVGSASQDILSQLPSIVVSIENGYLEVDEDLLDSLRGRLTALGNVLRCSLMTHFAQNDVRSLVHQEMTGIKSRESNKDTIIAMFEEELAHTMGIFNLTTNLIMQKVQLENISTYLSHQIDKVSGIYGVMIGTANLLTVVSIVCAIIGCFFPPLLVVSLIANVLSSVVRFLSTYLADKLVDDEYNPRGPSDVYAPPDDPSQVAQSDILNDLDQNLFIETDDGQIALDTARVAELLGKLNGIQNANRAYNAVHSEKASNRELVHMEMTGIGGRESSRLVSAATEATFAQLQFMFQTRLYYLNQLKMAQNWEIQQEKLVHDAWTALWLSLALTATGFVIGGPLGAAIGGAIGAALAQIIVNSWGGDVERIDTIAYKEIRSEHDPQSTEARLEQLEQEILMELLSSPFIGTGDGYVGINPAVLLNLRKRLGGIYNIKNALASLHEAKSSARALVHMEMTNVASRVSGELTSDVNRADFNTAMQQFNLITQFLNESVSLQNRARDAEKAMNRGWWQMGITIGLSAIGLGAGAAGVGWATAVLPGAIMSVNAIINAINYYLSAHSGFGSLNNQSTADMIKNLKSKNDPNSTMSRLEQMEEKALLEITEQLIRELGNGRWGVNMGLAAYYKDKIERIYNVKEAIARVREAIAEARNAVHRTMTGISGRDAAGKEVFSTDKSIALTIVDTLFMKLQMIAERHNQMTEAERQMWISIVIAAVASAGVAMKAITKAISLTIEALAKSLEEVTEKAAQLAEKIAEAAEEIERLTKELNEAVKQLKEATEEVTDELSEKVVELRKRIMELENKIRELKEKVEQFKAELKAAEEKITEINGKIKEKMKAQRFWNLMNGLVSITQATTPFLAGAIFDKAQKDKQSGDAVHAQEKADVEARTWAERMNNLNQQTINCQISAGQSTLDSQMASIRAQRAEELLQMILNALQAVGSTTASHIKASQGIQAYIKMGEEYIKLIKEREELGKEQDSKKVILEKERKDLAAFKGQETTLEAELKKLKEDEEALAKYVDSQKGKANERMKIEERLTTLRNEVARLKGDLESVKGLKRSKEIDVERIDKEIKELVGKISDANQKINNKAAEMHKAVKVKAEESEKSKKVPLPAQPEDGKIEVAPSDISKEVEKAQKNAKKTESEKARNLSKEKLAEHVVFLRKIRNKLSEKKPLTADEKNKLLEITETEIDANKVTPTSKQVNGVINTRLGVLGEKVKVALKGKVKEKNLHEAVARKVDEELEGARKRLGIPDKEAPPVNPNVKKVSERDATPRVVTSPVHEEPSNKPSLLRRVVNRIFRTKPKSDAPAETKIISNTIFDSDAQVAQSRESGQTPVRTETKPKTTMGGKKPEQTDRKAEVPPIISQPKPLSNKQLLGFVSEVRKSKAPLLLAYANVIEESLNNLNLKVFDGLTDGAIAEAAIDEGSPVKVEELLGRKPPTLEEQLEALRVHLNKLSGLKQGKLKELGKIKTRIVKLKNELSRWLEPMKSGKRSLPEAEAIKVELEKANQEFSQVFKEVQNINAQIKTTQIAIAQTISAIEKKAKGKVEKKVSEAKGKEKTGKTLLENAIALIFGDNGNKDDQGKEKHKKEDKISSYFVSSEDSLQGEVAKVKEEQNKYSKYLASRDKPKVNIGA